MHRLVGCGPVGTRFSGCGVVECDLVACGLAVGGLVRVGGASSPLHGPGGRVLNVLQPLLDHLAQGEVLTGQEVGRQSRAFGVLENSWRSLL